VQYISAVIVDNILSTLGNRNCSVWLREIFWHGLHNTLLLLHVVLRYILTDLSNDLLTSITNFETVQFQLRWSLDMTLY